MTVLAGTGALPRWQGLVHLVALPPLDLVADLKLLTVRATGVPSFVAGLVSSLLVRSAVMAWLLGGLSWGRLWFALRFYLAVLPVAFLSATLLYGAQAVLYYGLFWAGLVVSLALLALTGALPWLARDRLRSAWASSSRAGYRLGTVGAYLALLTVLGALVDLGPPGAAVALVPASALLTWVTVWMLQVDPGRPASAVVRRALAAAPAAGVVLVVAVVLTGPAAPPTAEAQGDRDGSIMLLSGIDSSSGRGTILEIDPRTMGWTCEQTSYFSYAGPGTGQPRGDAACPIDRGAPYEPEDTLRSPEELVPALEAQAATLQPPAVAVGTSRAAWLLWEAAATGRAPNVETLVLVGAFPENHVSYPRLGEHGRGRVGRLLLELLTRSARMAGFTVFRPDAPLGRERLAHPDAVEQVFARPLPGDVRALSVSSSFDLPLLQGDHEIEGATNACPVPVMHPNLPHAEELHRAITAFVDGEDLPPCPWWREVTGPTLRHFGAPPS